MTVTTVYSFLDTQLAISGGGLNYAIGGQGVAEGGFSIEMEGDKNTMTIGADGTGMHNLHASEAGTLTIRLLKTSPANGVLVTAYNAQKSNSLLWGKLSAVVNGNRGDSVTLTGGAFKKKPNLTYAMDGGENEFTFDFTSVEYQLGTVAA